MVTDLRSDTVTRPSPAMRRAIAEAEVGDACHGDDPTVNRLQAVFAERLGKEAALFVPSGTMGNQLAVAVQVRPGDAVFLEERAHIARWEVGAASAHSGAHLVTVRATDGLPAVDDLDAVRFPDHPRAPRHALLSLENTHNAAGGIPHDRDALDARVAWARALGMRAHCDGARLFNAAVALDTTAEDLAAPFDTVSACLSKGLGAPVGSVLVGDRAAIAEADRVRHRMGGGWRQAGLLAAAGLFALDRNVAGLADDHARAARLAEALVTSGVGRPLHRVHTNIVIFEVDPAVGDAAAFVSACRERGVLLLANSPTTARIVTHLDVDDAAVEHAVRVFGELT